MGHNRKESDIRGWRPSSFWIQRDGKAQVVGSGIAFPEGSKSKARRFSLFGAVARRTELKRLTSSTASHSTRLAPACALVVPHSVLALPAPGQLSRSAITRGLDAFDTISNMEMLERLWSVAEQEAKRTGSELSYVFDAIGLFLDRPLSNHGYDTTPVNSSTFASTGGDGVHYGLLFVDGKVNDDSPVVMTVPCNRPDEANVILGKNLHEFLCLGCQTGYFGLEQLVYQREETLALFQQPEPVSEREEQLLSLLKTELQLTPWKNVEARLDELNNKFMSLLKIAPQI
jgi:hypothetical protein